MITELLLIVLLQSPRPAQVAKCRVAWTDSRGTVQRGKPIPCANARDAVTVANGEFPELHHRVEYVPRRKRRARQ